MKIKAELHPDGHLDAALTHTALCRLHQESKHWQQALHHCEAALEMRIRFLDSDNPLVAASQKRVKKLKKRAGPNRRAVNKLR